MNGPLLGCIADDYTGATDLASNLVEADMRVVQCLGHPSSLDVFDGADAVVIALKTRSVPSGEAGANAALESLRAFVHLPATTICPSWLDHSLLILHFGIWLNALNLRSEPPNSARTHSFSPTNCADDPHDES